MVWPIMGKVATLPVGPSYGRGRPQSIKGWARIVRVEVWDSELMPWDAVKSVHSEGGFARATIPSDVLVGSTFGYLIGGYVV